MSRIFFKGKVTRDKQAGYEYIVIIYQNFRVMSNVFFVLPLIADGIFNISIILAIFRQFWVGGMKLAFFISFLNG